MKSPLIKIICIFFTSTFLNTLSANQPSGDIIGRIYDTTDNTGLAGVNIELIDTFLGTASDSDGNFRLRGIPVGIYQIRFTRIGYSPLIDTIRVQPSQTIRYDAALTPTTLKSPQLVVTGEKRSVRIQESTVSIGTVSDAEFRLRMPVTIDEVLPVQSGVQMVGGQVNIRGSSGYSRGAGSRVLVLVDGIQVLASDNDGIYWNALPSNNIQRVEILKGPGSALYGSNALGGVINIITKPISDSSQTTLRFQTGIYSLPGYSAWQWTDKPLLTNSVNIDHEMYLGSVGLRIGLQRESSDGYTQNGWFQRWVATGKFTHAPSAQSSWNGRAYLVHDAHGAFTQWRNANDPFQVPQESLGDYITNDHFQAALGYTHVASPDLSHTWRTIYFRKGFRNHQHDNNDYSISRMLSTEWQTDYQHSSTHYLTGGVQYTAENIQADIWGNHNGFKAAGYLQDEWKPNQLTRLVFGLRADFARVDSRQGFIQINPKVSLNHLLTANWSLRASVGRGFRTPSISEQYINTNQYIFRINPNPDLKAEISWSGEIGTHYERGTMTLDISAFVSRFYEFIEPVQNPGTGTISFENITDAQIAGLEISASGKIPWLPIRPELSYTFLHPRDITQDTVLAYRHEHTVNVITQFAISEQIYWSIEYQYRSKIQRVKVYPENPLTGADSRVPVHLWNIHAFFRPSDNLTLRVSAINLLSYSYVTIERNIGQPLHIRLGFDYTF